MQTPKLPATGAGRELTVMVFELKQPVESVYVIPAVPEETPVTNPVNGAIVADALLLVQLPPVTVLPSAVVDPSHTWSEPEIAVGVVFTVIAFVA